MKLGPLAPWVLAACTLPGCFFSPDTLHVRVRDPGAVMLAEGSQLVLAAHENGVDGQPAAPLERVFRTDDDAFTHATVTPSRGPGPGDSGIVERWDTGVHLAHGELFELVGQDGWVAALPLAASITQRDGSVFIRVSRQLSSYWSRTRSGYDFKFGDPRAVAPDQIVTLETPLANVERVERRPDSVRRFIGGALLVPGTVLTAIGVGVLVDPGKKSPVANRAIGGAVSGLGLAIDGLGLYNLIRGSRHPSIAIAAAP